MFVRSTQGSRRFSILGYAHVTELLRSFLGGCTFVQWIAFKVRFKGSHTEAWPLSAKLVMDTHTLRLKGLEESFDHRAPL